GQQGVADVGRHGGSFAEGNGGSAVAVGAQQGGVDEGAGRHAWTSSSSASSASAASASASASASACGSGFSTAGVAKPAAVLAATTIIWLMASSWSDAARP